MAAADLGRQLRSVFSGLSLRKKITLAVVTIATLAGLALMTMWAGRPDYQVLFSDLAVEDAGAIYEDLRARKVPCKVENNGRSILVPRQQVHELRLALAANGMPSGGGSVGFELFDDAKLGMTEFLQNVNYQRALQGELARTINRFEEIESSRVHIVMASRSLFTEDEDPATASVILKLRAGRRINANQVQGIVHLVSSSVSGLKPEHVTIVDQNGKILTGTEAGGGLDKGTVDQLAHQQSIEQGLEKRIKTMLDQALGMDKAVVRVSAAIDFKHHEQTEERYLADNRVVRSEKRFNESSQGGQASAGVPGVLSNMVETPAATASGGSGAGYQKNDDTVNYEIGKVTSHTVAPVGTVTRISVAALVDGTYRNVPGPDGSQAVKYIARSPEEIEKLANLIKRAVNFDPARGDQVEVVNIPFETSPLEDDLPAPDTRWSTRLREYSVFIKYGLLAIAGLLLFFMVIRPLVRWLTTSPANDGEMLKQLPMTVGELETRMGANSGGYRDQAIQLIATEQDASVDLMRQWIKES